MRDRWDDKLLQLSAVDALVAEALEADVEVDWSTTTLPEPEPESEPLLEPEPESEAEVGEESEAESGEESEAEVEAEAEPEPKPEPVLPDVVWWEGNRFALSMSEEDLPLNLEADVVVSER
jgi:hypothetical protein